MRISAIALALAAMLAAGTANAQSASERELNRLFAELGRVEAAFDRRLGAAEAAIAAARKKYEAEMDRIDREYDRRHASLVSIAERGYPVGEIAFARIRSGTDTKWLPVGSHTPTPVVVGTTQANDEGTAHTINGVYRYTPQDFLGNAFAGLESWAETSSERAQRTYKAAEDAQNRAINSTAATWTAARERLSVRIDAAQARVQQQAQAGEQQAEEQRVEVEPQAQAQQQAPVEEQRVEAEPQAQAQQRVPVEERRSGVGPQAQAQQRVPVEERRSGVEPQAQAPQQAPVEERRLEVEPQAQAQQQVPVEERRTGAEPQAQAPQQAPVEEQRVEVEPQAQAQQQAPAPQEDDELRMSVLGRWITIRDGDTELVSREATRQRHVPAIETPEGTITQDFVFDHLDYTTFGYWAEIEANELFSPGSGLGTGRAHSLGRHGVFATGDNPASVRFVTGTATYNGAAHGVIEFAHDGRTSVTGFAGKPASLHVDFGSSELSGSVVLDDHSGNEGSGITFGEQLTPGWARHGVTRIDFLTTTLNGDGSFDGLVRTANPNGYVDDDVSGFQGQFYGPDGLRPPHEAAGTFSVVGSSNHVPTYSADGRVNGIAPSGPTFDIHGAFGAKK